ncbi:DUF4232 domain-containing protein [Umezawaea sp. Da 62-37]|uniref:DUF4232 domain-containing protein n=1 Tax=Umezawaea sp. Da 62-37 TaxID=3075927 RepID=UPI0028F7312D|nr:DUF4232 domain-containing protein [Umezawaea sp. Da 62-37]WNV85729.1 DUF4232 domain-containing protein [Umezawaea sp. Da 62-37]
MSGIRRRTALVLSGIAPVALIAAVAVVLAPSASTSTVLSGDPSPLSAPALTSAAPPSSAPSSPAPSSTSTTPQAPSSGVGTVPATPTSAATSAVPPPAAVQPCRAQGLSARIDTPAGRFDASGHRGFLVVLTNAGAAPCSVLGFGTYSLLDAAGQPMRSVQHNAVWSGVDTIALAPGGQAYARVSYTVVPTGDEPVDGPCQPPTGALRVVPPGDAGTLDLPLRVNVCDHGRLEVTEFAGSDVF